MKNILTLVHADAGQEARFQVALDLARAVDGHLLCVNVVVPPVPVIEAFSRAGLQLATDEARDVSASNRSTLLDRLAVEGMPFDWFEDIGTIVSCLAKSADFADLIILNRNLTIGTPHMDRLVADVLVETGKPVLAVPEQQRALRVHSACAMIAWDGSHAAIHAIEAAAPILRLASDVTIVEVDDGSKGASSEEAARYLCRYGIKPAILRISGGDDYVPPLLLAHATTLHADYIVMGGFGHWRLIEQMIRGNSHWILGTTHVPLFMVH